MSTADHLPTAAEIMREALVLARGSTSGPHDFARAELLLKLAHELRVGSVPAGFVHPAERPDASGYEPESVPDKALTEETVAIPWTEGTELTASCVYCSQRLRTCGADQGGQPVWYHDLTMQTVCLLDSVPRRFAHPAQSTVKSASRPHP